MSSWWKKLTKHIGGALTGGASYLFTGLDDDDVDPAHLFTKNDAEKLSDEQWQWQKQKYDENFAFQQEQYNYQKWLNDLAMYREDTAVGRRVADLKASGLSPTLAAGSAADSGAMHAGQAPQYEVGVNPKLEAAMFKQSMQKDMIELASSVMGNVANIARTGAETQLIKAQTDQITSLTPVELAIKEQLLEFNDQMNPHKIKKAMNEIDLQEKEKAIKDFDLVLKSDEHAMKAYEMAKIELENKLIRANIDIATREYILKGVAVDMATAQYDEFQYAREFFHDRFSGAPAGYSLPSIYQSLPNQINNISGGIGEALESGWNKVGDFVSRQIDKINSAASKVKKIAYNPDIVIKSARENRKNNRKNNRKSNNPRKR